MKQKIIWAMISAIMVLLISACGSSNEEENTTGDEESDEVLPLEVSISTSPEMEQLEPGKEMTIQAKVTHGDETVDDAEEVQFEFWKEGQESDDHEMIEGESKGDGIYTIKKTVEEPGTYFVVSHVTARGMHNMPKKELMIGNTEGMDHEKEDSESHDHTEGHDHGGETMAHIMVEDTVNRAEKVDITGHVMKEDEPLTEADVRFEVWKDGSEQHEFLDTEEIKDTGKYKVAHTFEQAGTYHLKLHVEKGDLHTHNEKTITVE